MDLLNFSKRYKSEFLSRNEDNFGLLLEKIEFFYKKTRDDIGDGKMARRRLHGRFHYEEALKNVRINQEGITTEEVAIEFNDMLRGCVRHQDPTTAFNLIPSPLFDVIAGTTLINLYTPNTCWDFLSGKLCLFEKKIARMLGQLVNWPEADGFVVSGGKQALMYAIKNGMGRASLNRPTEMSDFVVIASSLAHYSIEHICHYLGISRENYLRVETHSSGEMDLESLEEAMEKVISENKCIAAIIAVGGGTINLVPDPILEIKQTIDQITQKHQLIYVPYLHVDSVISWTWLAFETDQDSFLKCQINPKIASKIKQVLSKLQGIHYADSFAADFHKTGFCSYAASAFIARKPNNLRGMTLNNSIPNLNLLFGEAESHYQTLENSRPATAIAAIWIALRRMGLAGLRQFLLYQLGVSEEFQKSIQESYSDHFEIINSHSNGWEIVLKPHFGQKISWDQLQAAPLETQSIYINACHHFLEHLWYKSLNEEKHRIPVIGFVKKYSRKGSHEKSFPAFLIHPTSLHYNREAIDELLLLLVNAKIDFDQEFADAPTVALDAFLCQCTPPK